jgi:hypothetical protein
LIVDPILRKVGYFNNLNILGNSEENEEKVYHFDMIHGSSNVIKRQTEIALGKSGIILPIYDKKDDTIMLNISYIEASKANSWKSYFLPKLLFYHDMKCQYELKIEKNGLEEYDHVVLSETDLFLGMKKHRLSPEFREFYKLLETQFAKLENP